MRGCGFGDAPQLSCRILGSGLFKRPLVVIPPGSLCYPHPVIIDQVGATECIGASVIFEVGSGFGPWAMMGDVFFCDLRGGPLVREISLIKSL